MLKRLMVAALVAVMAVPMVAAPASSATAGATEVNVRAVDYDFKGIPAELKVGPHRFNFENKGDHAHELIIVRKRASSSHLTWEELMRRDDAEEHIHFVGFSSAKPGETGDGFRAYLKAGKYLAVCFFQNDKDSKPHAFKGMFRKFHVSK